MALLCDVGFGERTKTVQSPLQQQGKLTVLQTCHYLRRSYANVCVCVCLCASMQRAKVYSKQAHMRIYIDNPKSSIQIGCGWGGG